MEPYDINIIEYKGRPLFQSSKMVSSRNLKNSLEDIACFIYVVKGSGEITESNGNLSISKEEALVKSCGNFIASYFKDEEGNDFETVVIYFYPDILEELYGDLNPGSLNSRLPHPPKKIISNQLVEKFINGLHLYFQNPEMIDDSLLQHKLKELIMILLRSDYYASVVDLFSGLFSSKQKSFRQIVENNIYSPISLDELAFLTHRSLSTFKRDFKKAFNETPARYIKKKRLEKAASLLLHTEDSITDIAYACSFQDLSTFSSVFRDVYQKSPSEYRMTQNRKLLS